MRWTEYSLYVLLFRSILLNKRPKHGMEMGIFRCLLTAKDRLVLQVQHRQRRPLREVYHQHHPNQSQEQESLLQVELVVLDMKHSI